MAGKQVFTLVFSGLFQKISMISLQLKNIQNVKKMDKSHFKEGQMT